MTHNFSFAWQDDQATKGQNAKEHLKPCKGGERVGYKGPLPSTHWLLPGRLLCGRSPGGFSDEGLKALVGAGVEVFVNLQASYTEYGGWDYKQKIVQLAENSGGNFPPHDVRFLHCPIPDFGVLEQTSLLALGNPPLLLIFSSFSSPLDS